jgi:steroid 5-alpha reductase family enzyme
VAIFLFLSSEDKGLGKILMLSMVCLWAIRLGSYLLYRIKKMNRDRRFDGFRGNWLGFLKFWILQSVSIWIIALPAMIFLIKKNPEFYWWGIIVWGVGFVIETIADAQKFSFKLKHKDQFMDKGLFSKVRYPNYTGEILCWLGIFIFALPAFQGMEWLAIISPIWITILLLFISGIPLLEKQYEEKYGHEAKFQAYKKETPMLIPFLF